MVKEIKEEYTIEQKKEFDMKQGKEIIKYEVMQNSTSPIGITIFVGMIFIIMSMGLAWDNNEFKLINVLLFIAGIFFFTISYVFKFKMVEPMGEFMFKQHAENYIKHLKEKGD